jgi:Fic family protein
MDGARGRHKDPGEYRRIPNWIGPEGCTIEQARFVPPGADRIESAMTGWEAYIHAEAPDRLVQLAIVHAEFESIHPFLDGNGRIGRLIIPLFLYAHGAMSAGAGSETAFRSSATLAVRVDQAARSQLVENAREFRLLKREAALAAADTAMLPRHLRIDIPGTVRDDGARRGVAVAFVKPIEAQRAAIFPIIIGRGQICAGLRVCWLVIC